MHLIRAFSYEPRSGRLIVALIDGRICVYDAVPAEVADEFFHAESKGGFFAACIRDRYRSREVTRRAA